METASSARFYKFLALASLIVAAAAGGYIYSQSRLVDALSAAAPAGAVNMAAATPRAAHAQAGNLPDFAEIAQHAGPAVVNISVLGAARSGAAALPGLEPDSPFYDFFRRFHGPTPPERAPQRGMGSGFIVSAEGVILTNAHVVADADEVTVKLTDKREFKAKLVGMDRLSDVAVLKIDAKDLPTVVIGNPETSRVGDWVVAIGSPFGFESSVTAGIISAKSRSLPDEGYVPFLQTDVAINPGNSGGPLFNMRGEVVGINSQIYSRSGGYQGLSFAIPIDVAMKVKQQLLDHGKVSRGRIGVMIQDLNQDLADSFGLDKPAGALVSSVEKGGPADKAGIEPGDVILKFNDIAIVRSGDLPPLVAEQAPGSKMRLDVWHKGKLREIKLTLGEMKLAGDSTGRISSDKDKTGKLGLAVRPLSAEERREAEVNGGLLVEEVADGPAEKAGVQAGDIILAVNGERINSLDQLREQMTRGGKYIALQIQRDGSRMFVPIRVR